MRTIQEHNRLCAIIPALDAAGTLGACLAALAGAETVGDIVVVDGGSHDVTAAIAREGGARVIAAPRGRGTQLAAGAAATTGAWLLFLHADCRLDRGWEKAVRAFMDAPGAEGRAGYFALALDNSAPAARRLERLVAWRCRALGLPYGDQGLLISRALYDGFGGFAAIPLMEDVEFARRLGRKRLAPIPALIVASARRYRDGGYVRRPLRNLLCLSLYFAGVTPRRLVRFYG